MGKIGLIIAREYITRIRTRAFILLTILGPLAYGGIIGVSSFMAARDTDKDVEIKVVDQSGLFTKKELVDFGQTKFSLLPEMTVNNLEDYLEKEDQESIGLFIPKDILAKTKGVKIFYSEHPGSSLINRIEDILEGKISKERMIEKSIDEKVLSYLDVNVKIEELHMGEDGAEVSNANAATVVAYASGFLLYMFIFIYGSLVLRGVQEEKSSRIVEVIISSVRPFQLMMGKIIGNGLLGLTQFAVWIILLFLIMFGISFFVDPGAAASMAENSAQAAEMQSLMGKMGATLGTLPLTQIVIYFILFFLCGYFLYSSLFAAVAASVDSQQDMQQFMLPLSAPLIIAMVVLSSVVKDPNGGVAVFFSMFPFTSPIIMAARIPFGIPWYEPIIALIILIGTFFLFVSIAAKIYRIGLLMYGSKPSWKQLGKWIFSKQ